MSALSDFQLRKEREQQQLEIERAYPHAWIGQHTWVKRHKGWSEFVMMECGEVIRHYGGRHVPKNGLLEMGLPPDMGSIVGEKPDTENLKALNFHMTTTIYRHTMTERKVIFLPAGAEEWTCF